MAIFTSYLLQVSSLKIPQQIRVLYIQYENIYQEILAH